MARGTRTLGIVGAGSVGSSLAYASLLRGSAERVALYDINTAKVNAEVRDLADGTQFAASHKIDGGDDVAVLKDSDVVIITAGAKQHPGQTRLELAETNVAILKKMMPDLLGQAPDAVYILVTNPCDVLTVVAHKISGLPRGHVFSTGTMLDTARLRWQIAQRAGIHQSNVHAVIMGEHGDSEFPAWSNATIGRTPILDWQPHGDTIFTPGTLTDMAHTAKHAAYSIIEGKGATNYAIGIAGARLVEDMLEDNSTILPVSSVLDDYYGVGGVALSVPSIISGDGIVATLEEPLSDDELRQLYASADQLKHALREVGF